MIYEPQSGDVVDMFLSCHSEERIFRRFPSLRLRNDYQIYTSYCVSEKAAPMWSIPIAGGVIIGKWEKSKPGSYIKGIFIAQTALFNWQFNRSGFVRQKVVQIQFRRINSQIANKIKAGKECREESVSALMAVSSMVSAPSPRNLLTA